jgi:hypothetical protein
MKGAGSLVMRREGDADRDDHERRDEQEQQPAVWRGSGRAPRRRIGSIALPAPARAREFERRRSRQRPGYPAGGCAPGRPMPSELGTAARAGSGRATLARARVQGSSGSHPQPKRTHAPLTLLVPSRPACCSHPPPRSRTAHRQRQNSGSIAAAPHRGAPDQRGDRIDTRMDARPAARSRTVRAARQARSPGRPSTDARPPWRREHASMRQSYRPAPRRTGGLATRERASGMPAGILTTPHLGQAAPGSFRAARRGSAPGRG